MADSDKIRVLIVDDNEDTRYVIQRLLDYEEDIEIVDFAEDGEEALEKVEALSPDVVLMDINMRGMNGIEATQKLNNDAPRSKVIIVSVQDDPGYMRSAMRAGAVDFLAKPPRPDDLIQAIRRAKGMIVDAPPPQPSPSQPGQDESWRMQQGGQPVFGGAVDGKVISVMGLKGGVGKTTIAVSLAVGLARLAKDKSVLLIDTNTYSGDVHIFLNTRGQYNVVETAYMAQDAELDAQGLEGILVPHESGVKLLVAPRNPLDSDPLPGDAFERLIKDLRKQFDYIVLDTGTTIDGGLVSVVQASDYIAIVTQAIMPALKDTQVLMQLLRELGALVTEEVPEGEPAGKDILVVLNNYDERTSRIKADRIGDFLRAKVDVEVASDPNAISSLNDSRPLIDNDPRHYPAVEGLRNLVKVVRERVEPAAVAAGGDDSGKTQSGGFLSSVFGRKTD